MSLDAMFAGLPQTIEEARQLDTEVLLSILGNVPLAVVRVLMIHAAVWTVLEERDPASLRPFIQSNNAVYKWVRRIANRTAAAEAICEFGIKTRLVQLVTELPLVEQKRLAADPVVKVLDANTQDTVKRSLHDLDEPELRRVFDLTPGDERVRSIPQQAAFLRPLSPPPAPLAKKPREVTVGRIKFNPATRRIRIDGPDADIESVEQLLTKIGYTVTPPE